MALIIRGLLFSLPKHIDHHPMFEATPVLALLVSSRTKFHRVLLLLEQPLGLNHQSLLVLQHDCSLRRLRIFFTAPIIFFHMSMQPPAALSLWFGLAAI
jgi:hypothetical protein